MGAAILDALIGTMSPLIPAIIGGSMLKLLAMVLEMTGVLEKGSSTLPSSRWPGMGPSSSCP
ncbi:hypothetical protein ACLK2G_14335 [Escherichia coli]